MSERLYLVVWDMYGLENIVDITKEEKMRLFEILKDGEDTAWQKISCQVYYAIMRAKLNTQRCYEIYVVATDPTITTEYLIDAFRSNPQTSAELIRERGTKLYSDRTDRKQVIT